MKLKRLNYNIVDYIIIALDYLCNLYVKLVEEYMFVAFFFPFVICCEVLEFVLTKLFRRKFYEISK